MTAEQFQDKLLSIQGNMRSFARSLTMDDFDAQDLMQDTTLKALNNREKFVDNVNFKAWVLTIMRNIFINNYHKITRRQKIVDYETDLQTVPLLNEGGEFTPEGSMDLKEITRAIASLNQLLKEPFSMYVTGYKYHEIAEALDIPLGTVKSRIHLARKELQETLRDLR